MNETRGLNLSDRRLGHTKNKIKGFDAQRKVAAPNLQSELPFDEQGAG
jgi:hypothetical protein